MWHRLLLAGRHAAARDRSNSRHLSRQLLGPGSLYSRGLLLGASITERSSCITKLAAEDSDRDPALYSHVQPRTYVSGGRNVLGMLHGSGVWSARIHEPRCQASAHFFSSNSGDGKAAGSALKSGSTTPALEPHEGGIYVHHADIGAVVNSMALTIGLFHAAQVLRPGLGYFRPIDQTSHGGYRSKLIKDVFKMDSPLSDMQGCSQDEAYDLLEAERLDDLMEIILQAYERLKARHDYLVVEGTSMRDGSITSPLNATIASALGCPALLICDAEAAAQTDPKHAEKSMKWEDWDWEKEAVSAVVDHARIMRQSNADVAGALLYKVPATSRGSQRLREYLKQSEIPFVGAIPEDSLLQSFQVEDVRRVLKAHVLYGEKSSDGAEDDRAALSSEVTQTLVATQHLADLMTYLPSSSDPTKGALVIAHSSRPDILLGMINLHETDLPTNVAAMVLTGGLPPPIEVDNIIRRRPTPCRLPVLLAPTATHDTCVALAKAQPEFNPTSTRKIERAEVIFLNNVDMNVLNDVLFKTRPVKMNPRLFQHNLFEKAKAAQKHIILPEGAEPRTIQAAGEILRRGIASLTMLGQPDEILNLAKQLRVDLEGVALLNPAGSPNLDAYTDLLFERRKHKGLTREMAKEQLSTDPNFFGTAMVAAGHADGMVSGAIHTTADTVRPALQLIKTSPETPLVSSVFFMCLPDRVLVYGDCAINTNPSAADLATIAISSADSAAAFGIEPRVALLSYATGDSNAGPLIEKVAEAREIAKKRRPELAIEGPLQYDAAINPDTARTKMKGRPSEVAGKATVLIFPDLNTGNNTYKAVQQSTGAVAIGPMLQGLRRPVNDLSRGCTVKDIVTTVTITCIQAAAMTNPGP